MQITLKKQVFGERNAKIFLNYRKDDILWLLN